MSLVWLWLIIILYVLGAHYWREKQFPKKCKEARPLIAETLLFGSVVTIAYVLAKLSH